MDNIQQLRLIYRVNEPTKMDTADHLALCRVGYDQQNFDEREYYIQLSPDEENPRWHKLGTMYNETILFNLIDLLKVK